MAILPVRHLPDPVLRRKAKKVATIDKSIRELIDNMVETMHAATGVGLAAPQVGVSLRVIFVEMPGEAPQTVINPEVVKRSGVREVVEACLSVPGYAGEIERSLAVVVKGQDRQGRKIRIKASDLLAQALEHEIDHLDGVLYIDRVKSQEKLYKIEPGSTEKAY